MDDFFDFLDSLGDFFEGIHELNKELVTDVKGIIDDTINDICLEFRDAGKDFREDIKINTYGTPLEPIVEAADAIGDGMRTLGKTISNPVSVGELITDFSKLQEGDHIFVSRIAYTHHGIYVGDDEVIHYAPDEYDDTCIHKTSIYKFGEFGSVFRLDKAHSLMRYSPKRVADRARSRLHETDYNLIFNNCEHFARWCRCGDNY